MEYVYGAIAGGAFGWIVGYLKYAILWKKIIKDEANADAAVSGNMVLKRMIASWAINAATLFAVYFARNIIPFDFSACIIAAAVALSVAGKIYSANSVIKRADF